jgi:hypothetical protein
VNLEWYIASEEFIKTNKNLPRYTKQQIHKEFSNIWTEKVRPDLSNYGLQVAMFDENDFLKYLGKKGIPSEMPEALFARSWYKSSQRVIDSFSRLLKKL